MQLQRFYAVHSNPSIFCVTDCDRHDTILSPPRYYTVAATILYCGLHEFYCGRHDTILWPTRYSTVADTIRYSGWNDTILLPPRYYTVADTIVYCGRHDTILYPTYKKMRVLVVGRTNVLILDALCQPNITMLVNAKWRNYISKYANFFTLDWNDNFILTPASHSFFILKPNLDIEFILLYRGYLNAEFIFLWFVK